MTLICQPYVLLAKYVLHAEEAQPFRVRLSHLIGDPPRDKDELDLKHLEDIDLGLRAHLITIGGHYDEAERDAGNWLVNLTMQAAVEEAERQARPAE